MPVQSDHEARDDEEREHAERAEIDLQQVGERHADRLRGEQAAVLHDDEHRRDAAQRVDPRIEGVRRAVGLWRAGGLVKHWSPAHGHSIAAGCCHATQAGCRATATTTDAGQAGAAAAGT